MDAVLQAILPGIRRPGCEANHSHLCSAGLGMNGDVISTPLPKSSSWRVQGHLYLSAAVALKPFF